MKKHRFPMKVITTLFVLSLAAAALPSLIVHAQTSTITVTADADAYVSRNSPNSNFGSSTSLRVDNSPTIRSYLRFNIPSLNGGTITSAKLSVFADSRSPSGYGVQQVADTSWNESQITYSNAPALGSSIGKSRSFKPGQWVDVDVSSYVKKEGEVSLALTALSPKAVSLASRESPNKPTLYLTIVYNMATATSPAPGATATSPATQSPAPTSTPTRQPSPTNAPTQPPAPTTAPTQPPAPTTAPTQPPAPTPVPTQKPSPTAAPTNPPTSTNNYYVDSAAGSDSNPGTSDTRPWKTLGPVNAANFPAGSVIHFKRGGSWSGWLTIHNSGTQSSPITITDYGTGNAPAFSNPGSQTNKTSTIKINGSYVVVQNVFLQNAQEAGVYISNGANYNTVRNVEATNVGVGVLIYGQHNVVTGSYIHDLHMVTNTPGGNDDNGAVGVSLMGSYNEVSSNRIERCKAPSYDYGTDGGAVELYGSIDGSYVHHNWMVDNNGGLEIGGGRANDLTVAYNVFANNGDLWYAHLTGTFGSTISNVRIENNTIYEKASGTMGWKEIGFDANPNPSTFILRNNIFYVDYFQSISSTSSITHDHNLYYLPNGTQLGFSLGTGEKIADPLFVNLSGRDFHLQAGSPAIDAGVNLNMSPDFDGHTVPSGNGTDEGAYER